jgi:hypothetical protein
MDPDPRRRSEPEGRVPRAERERRRTVHRVLVHIPLSEKKRPTPANDFTDDEQHLIENRYYGFETPEHAHSWFSPKMMTRLGSEGFKLTPVHAKRVWRSISGKQVLFEPLKDPVVRGENGQSHWQGIPPATIKSEDDHAEAEFNLAKEMLGFSFQADSYFDTARWMAGVEQSISRLHYRQVLLKHDGDIELAALAAYGFDFTDENLRALRGLVGSGSLAKAEEQPVPPPESLVPAHPDGTDAAEEVRRGFDAGTFRIVAAEREALEGLDDGDGPGDQAPVPAQARLGRQPSPASGVHEEDASQSRREAAFWHVADALHLGEYLPRADLLYIDGKEVAAIQMLPLSFKNLGDAAKSYKAVIPQAHDAVSRLRDHAQVGHPRLHPRQPGPALAEPHARHRRREDHAADRPRLGDGRRQLRSGARRELLHPLLPARVHLDEVRPDGPGQQLRQMPTAGIDGEKALARWLRDIDQKRLAAKLQSYGIDPEPMVARLEYIKMLPGPKDQGINVEHP